MLKLFTLVLSLFVFVVMAGVLISAYVMLTEETFPSVFDFAKFYESVVTFYLTLK